MRRRRTTGGLIAAFHRRFNASGRVGTWLSERAFAVYVLHAFEKKSPSGVRTARTDIALVAQRLKGAQQDYEGFYGKPKR